MPADLGAFAKTLDASLRAQNIYYDDLVKGKVLQPLRVTQVRVNGFRDYMASLGKLGGQNKVARLSNDRGVVAGLGG